MRIRLLVEGDQELVQNIMLEHPVQFPKFIIEKYPERWNDFLKEGSAKSRFYVASEDTDNIRGHAGYIHNEDLGLFEIVGVAVKKGMQRQGIGKMLINTICSEVKSLGQNELILYTLGHLNNEATLDFYRNLGFDIVNYEIDFFRAGFHRVTFVKKLECSQNYTNGGPDNARV